MICYHLFIDFLLPPHINRLTIKANELKRWSQEAEMLIIVAMPGA